MQVDGVMKYMRNRQNALKFDEIVLCGWTQVV